jgi:stearoyl-CoA desaturase (delta-9 desaturase)
MAPNVTSSPTDVLCTPEATLHSSNEIRAGVEKPTLKYRREIVWSNVFLHMYLNLAALYGAYLMLTSAKMLTGLWGMCKCLYVCNDV